jgi:hypothetical protein
MGVLSFGVTNAVKNYVSNSQFTNIKNTMKSGFGQSDRADLAKNGVMNYQDIQAAKVLSNMFVIFLIITGIIIGFMAVPNLCPDQSERGKNVRLGLFFLLIITGGQIGWFLGLLWLFKLNICI